MNWFTKDFISNHSLENKKQLIAMDSSCEHCKSDPSLAHCVGREKDSFGTVASHVMCAACYEKQKEEEQEEKHVCCDCSLPFPLKQGQMWKPYDFYAPQGDVPSFVCSSCADKPRHRNRVAQDAEDRFDELGY